MYLLILTDRIEAGCHRVRLLLNYCHKTRIKVKATITMPPATVTLLTPFIKYQSLELKYERNGKNVPGVSAVKSLKVYRNSSF